MAEIHYKRSVSRRWPLFAALGLGVLGGAAADAVVTLRGMEATAAERAASQAQTSVVEPASDVTVAMPEATACSCVNGVDASTSRSPLAPKRKHGRKGNSNALAHTNICAASVATQP